ncbi:hypothetical protein [Haloarcula sp. JP-L23]|uniref:hypothetical protein n=1 Tax=Haloarcula sp. JP-L23 TaxID=2716717 RepID=UPI00140F1D70|nr:hypothetical protein G9465_12380 [Haloarcula sp. JP-L23]
MTNDADLLRDLERNPPMWRFGLVLLTGAVTGSIATLASVAITVVVLAELGMAVPTTGVSAARVVWLAYCLAVGFVGMHYGGFPVAERLWLTPAERRAAE